MKERNIFIWNMIVFVLLSFFIAGLQTSFWPPVLRFLSGANIWIFLTIYVCIFRNFHHALIFIYINTLFLHAYTSAPLGIILTLQILLLAVCNFFRSRVFWPTVSYYFIVSALSIILYEIFFMLLSNTFEVMPAERFAWRELFITLIITPVVGFLIFSMGRFIDRMLPPPQIGASQS